MLLQRIYCNLIHEWINWWASCTDALLTRWFLVWVFLVYFYQARWMMLLFLVFSRAFTLPEFSLKSLSFAKWHQDWVPEHLVITEILDSDSNDYTSKVGKDLTIIQSKVTVITEKKKVKVCTKFTVPHGQHVFWQWRLLKHFLIRFRSYLDKKDLNLNLEWIKD